MYSVVRVVGEGPRVRDTDSRATCSVQSRNLRYLPVLPYLCPLVLDALNDPSSFLRQSRRPGLRPLWFIEYSKRDLCCIIPLLFLSNLSRHAWRLPVALLAAACDSDFLTVRTTVQRLEGCLHPCRDYQPHSVAYWVFPLIGHEA